jgi:hypothetical protein
MTRLPWKRGPLSMHAGPYFVSATRFTYASKAALARVVWAGLRLRSGWAWIPGAVGLSVMAELRTRSTYTVSVWTSYADLQAWVRTAQHAQLMKAYRSLLTDSAYEGWEVASLNLAACWRDALERIRL